MCCCAVLYAFLISGACTSIPRNVGSYGLRQPIKMRTKTMVRLLSVTNSIMLMPVEWKDHGRIGHAHGQFLLSPRCAPCFHFWLAEACVASLHCMELWGEVQVVHVTTCDQCSLGWLLSDACYVDENTFDSFVTAVSVCLGDKLCWNVMY